MAPLLAMLVQGTLMATVALVLRRPLLRILPASFMRLLWIMVALRLLVPFPSPLSSTGLPPVSIPQGVLDVIGFLPSENTIAPAVETAVGDSGQQLSFLLVTVWLAVSTLLLVWMSLRYACFYLSLRHAAPVVESVLGGWLREKTFRRTVRVRTMEGVLSPFTYGVVRPVVIVPRGFGRHSSETDYMAFSHELVHVSRMDVLLKLSLNVVSCLYWFNPIILIAKKAAFRDIELACDEAVLINKSAESRKAYAVSLVRNLACLQASKTTVPVVPFGTSEAPSMKERILRIKRPAIHVIPRSLFIALFVASVMVGTALADLVPSNPGEVSADSYVFTIPQEWRGRVSVYADGNTMTVYPIGCPQTPLLSVFEVDSETPILRGDEGSRPFWRAVNDGGRYEAWAINYPALTAGGQGAMSVSTSPVYLSDAVANEVISLCTGGVWSLEQLMAAPDDGGAWEEYYLGTVASNLRLI